MQGKIVLVGIWGAGMSNIAGILRELWYTNIIGINSEVSQITQQLQEKGIRIFSHDEYQIHAEDIVIYSSAAEGSIEVQTAKKLKKEEHTPLLIWDYFEFLGEISKYFKTVGFTGTNGKSSSSALAIFTAKHLLPDFWIGIVWALVPDFWGKSYVLGESALSKNRLDDKSSKQQSDLRNIFNYIFTGRKLDYTVVKKYYFFVEACEYQRHFLHLDLDIAIITNITLDHTDYFKDLADYESAFKELVKKVKYQVFVLPDFRQQTILKDAKAIVVEPQHFDFQYIWGEHQQKNASLVAGLLEHLQDDKTIDTIKKTIEPFKGIWRRMEFLKESEQGAQIFSDYGHVAESLEVGYQALKEKFPDKKLICIFQPHQMHRILLGWDNFPEALQLYDERYIYDIYAARERIEDFAHEELFKEMHLTSVEGLGTSFANHCNAQYLTSFPAVEDIIKKADEKSIIVVYSAGDIDYSLRKHLKLA